MRSWFGESLNRNRLPPGIQRSELEERKVEVDCVGVVAKERVEFRGDEGRVLGVSVWSARYGGRWYGCPRYHPRVGVWLLVLVVVDNVGSLISIIQRSPAREGVVGRNSQSGRAQEGGRHPRVPGRTSGARARGRPGIVIEDLAASDGCVGSGWIGEVNGRYVR